MQQSQKGLLKAPKEGVINKTTPHIKPPMHNQRKEEPPRNGQEKNYLEGSGLGVLRPIFLAAPKLQTYVLFA